MNRIKKTVIFSFIALVIIVVGGIGLYNAFIDENSLTIKEKRWIDNNSSNLISITIPNDIPVFGNTGAGVFFDFSEYLSKDLGLNINNNTISYLSSGSEYFFEVSSNYEPDTLTVYRDHFVLVSKNNGVIANTSSIVNLKPGVHTNTMGLVTDYFGKKEDSFVSYDSYSRITEDLANGTLEYALVPLNEYKDQIISNNINIIAHVSDLNKYYYFKLGQNEILNSILTKTFKSWMKKNYETSYNKNNYDLFISSLKITEAEEDTLSNKVYKYGFVETRPYELSSGGSNGGITIEYLTKFTKFSGVDFTYKKYKTATELAEAAINKDVDLYYNYYNIVTNFVDVGALKQIDYYVIANNSIDLNVSNINSLSNKTVYVLADSYLYDVIKDIPKINIVTYSKTSELNHILNKDAIIVIDKYTYDYYVTNSTNDYTIRYESRVNKETYSFRYQNDTDTFFKLFNAYIKTIDPQELLRTGITSYNRVDEKSKIVSQIAKVLLGLVGLLIIVYIAYRKSNKKIKLDTKIRKDEKLKYVDLLTSLKNRNYYNEKLSTWNKNTIYPQACIVLDINNVKDLNDSYGHVEGDRQIQAVANALFKTQIDNTEIMRTDGNEFFVYMVGYSEKQVVTYMKKLVKEFKKLPYDDGVAMGFSMIEDDTKLVEDAYNEAVIKMRENKSLYEVYNDKKN